MLEVVLIGTAALLMWCGWFFFRSPKSDGLAPAFTVPAGIAIRAEPLLSESEVALYNLLRMAVQEHYLVLAQVPLWSFVSVEAMDHAGSQVLRQMALKRVDFVLVHPGSRQVEQVVEVETASPRPHQAERQRVIESVLGAAGIKLVTLRSDRSYTIPDLAGALGLETAE